MSRELTRTESRPARRRYRLGGNTMTFPRELRDAIPDLPTCVGRALELAEMDGDTSNNPLFGPRVHLRLAVKETGKLKGEFAVRMDFELDAARGLAETLQRLVNELSAE